MCITCQSSVAKLFGVFETVVNMNQIKLINSCHSQAKTYIIMLFIVNC